MDHDCFDGLARSLGATASRRDFGRAVAGGGLGTLLGVALGAPAADAKKQRGKKQGKTRKPTTVTRTVRGPVTRTFTSTAPIAVPNTASVFAKGNADPYPTIIDVTGFVNGVITDVNVTLHGFSHTQPNDVEILLVPLHLQDQNALLMSDVGNGHDLSGITLTLDDQAPAPLSENDPLTSGAFRPTDANGDPDSFPGQTPIGNSLLSVFNGGNPNGSWQLFVVDDSAGNTGQFATGWSLQITAEADIQVQERVKDKKHKKKGKKRR